MINPQQLHAKFAALKTRTSKNILTVDATGPSIRNFAGKSLAYAAGQYHMVDDTGGVPTGHVPEGQAAADLNRIEELFKKDHVTVKRDARWHRMYMGQYRSWSFVNPSGKEHQRPIVSYPCHYCGLILPIDFIEVDHRQPQASPGVAVLKVIHSLTGAYTAGHAGGKKATAVAAIAAAPAFTFQHGDPSIMALPTIPPKGYATGGFWGEASLQTNAAKAARYTITPAGQTFLTLAGVHFGTGVSGIEKYCLNSLLNLVPSCPLCNGASSKGSLVHGRGMMAI